MVFRQPDLGSALVVASLYLGIVFSAGIPLKFLSLGLISTGISLPIFWHFLKDYQRVRLTNFINPLTDPLKGGYHLLQSIIAVGSGQFLGRGLGQGTQSQLRFLPESHTDFIFASLGEELGFLGTSLLICLYGLMFLGILRAAKKSPDQFGQLVCVGVFSMFLFQVFINIGMNIGLVPITGITLPFISFGGSSLLSSLICLGLVISVSLRGLSQEMFEIQ